MKKALSLLLSLLLLAALSACGQKDPAGSTDDPDQERKARLRALTRSWCRR